MRHDFKIKSRVLPYYMPVRLSAHTRTCLHSRVQFNRMASTTAVKSLQIQHPDSHSKSAHHVGNPPTSFNNPWPSFQKITLPTIFKTRFGNHPEKNFVPVPEGPNGARSDELVKVRKPSWGQEKPDRLRATWIGHASFLVETPAIAPAKRGVRILFDPVFSERTSPFSFLGPKRYTPTPCSIAELPEVDAICISHNHYDHLDYHTIIELYRLRKGNIHFFVPLNDKAWFVKYICPSECVTEMDWWQGCELDVKDIGSVELTCTPSQHSASRSGYDRDRCLWCSWSLDAGSKKMYFAGDTGYQAVGSPSPCPAFKDIGKQLGPYDLALLPIGLCTPQVVMGSVHATPEQSLQIHKEIGSKLSIGMHYGTVRGGISGQYEPVTDPPRRWREAAEKESLWRGGGIEGKGSTVDTSKDGVGLCDVGETVCI